MRRGSGAKRERSGTWSPKTSFSLFIAEPYSTAALCRIRPKSLQELDLDIESEDWDPEKRRDATVLDLGLAHLAQVAGNSAADREKIEARPRRSQDLREILQRRLGVR